MGRLLRAAPNPVADRVAVWFELAAAPSVRLTLVDALGREVAVVTSGDRAVGRHDVAADV
ncbi:hypothetical protein [Rubrivirga sp. IMCC43871]|uniref:hypothetical protein n=1 Tax=Rubrivirga sp. IMCC43871 TaxID=3391575 RepID=UPI00398FB1EB